MQSQVPAPRPSRQVRSKASRALRGVRTRRDQSPEPRSGEEGPGSAQRRGRVLASCPALFSLPSDADSTGCSRERAPGREGVARGALARLCFALSVPTSSRRLGPASSWCGLLPAWLFASLPFSLALCPPFFFPGRFSPPSSPFSTLFLQAPVDCARVPNCPWPSPRENKAIRPRHANLKRSPRLRFRRIRASPSEMGGERKFRRLALSSLLGRGQSLRSVSPSILEPETGRPSAQKRPLAGNGLPGLL